MPFAPIFPTPFLTWLFFLGAIFALLAVTVIGFLAATFDSLLGATVQARYLIPATGKITEDRTAYSGQEVVVHSGWSWLDNNLVNLVCTGSGAALGLLWLAVCSGTAR